MTIETTTTLPARAVLDAVREFLLGPERLGDAWIDSESDAHVSFHTFRGNLALAAFPDREREGRTRVRVTTLREENLVPRLLTYIESLGDRIRD